MTTSFTNLGKSQDSTDNNDVSDGFAPRPITSRYISTQKHLSVLKDAIGAHPEIGMDDDHLPPIKWAHAIENALYERDGSLGELQKDAPYTVDDFKDQHGDAITTPHADLTDGERTELTNLLEAAGKDTETVENTVKLPEVNGERLPLLVADEEAFERGKELLEALVEEAHNDAGSTTDEVDDEDDETEKTGEEGTFTRAVNNAGLDRAVVDADLEGFSVPSAGTLDDLENTVERVMETNAPLTALTTLLTLEKANKDRKGGVSMLESAIETVEESDDETDDETDDDESASSTTGGLSDEDKKELATTVATAVVEALDN